LMRGFSVSADARHGYFGHRYFLAGAGF
jgi:hypothetical protein